MATSSDGYIADSDHSVDWLNDLQASHPFPDGDDGGFSRFMDATDAIVMGRKTYETVLSFVETGVAQAWPYGNKLLCVLSKTPGAVKIPEETVGNSVWATTPGRDGLLSVLEDVRARFLDNNNAGGSRGPSSATTTTTTRTRVYIDGGACVRSFAEEGLVDTVVLTRVPLALGGGVSLFTEEQTARLEELETATLANGFVQTRYKFR